MIEELLLKIKDPPPLTVEWSILSYQYSKGIIEYLPKGPPLSNEPLTDFKIEANIIEQRVFEEPDFLKQNEALRRKLDEAIKINELENKIYVRTQLNSVVHFDSDFDARRNKYEMLREKRIKMQQDLVGKHEDRCDSDYVQKLLEHSEFERQVIQQTKDEQRQIKKIGIDLKRKLIRNKDMLQQINLLYTQDK